MSVLVAGFWATFRHWLKPSQSSRTAAARDHSIAIGGNVYGDVYQGPAPKDGREALAIYRFVLAYTTSRLSLRGLDIGASDATRKQAPLDLAQVYVDLDTTTKVLDVQDEKSLQDESKSRPLSALEAVIGNRRLVLLGSRHHEGG